jgi:hypothetical protein
MRSVIIPAFVRFVRGPSPAAAVAVAVGLPTVVVAGVLWLRPLVEPAAAQGKFLPQIFACVEDGDMSALRAALERGTPADTRDPATRSTPLMWAARLGRLEMIELLVSRGADVNATCGGYGTPLMHAAMNRRPESARRLQALGAAPPVASPSGVTPLITAATVGDEKVIDVLLRAGADVNAADNKGRTALIAAEDAADTTGQGPPRAEEDEVQIRRCIARLIAARARREGMLPGSLPTRRHPPHDFRILK